MGRNPLYQEFEYGESDEGYWTYERMVLQLEDCTDILKYFHPSIDLISIFNHPYGRDKGIENRMNITKKNIGYVRTQQEIHPTEINK